jgi:hypothetical protein
MRPVFGTDPGAPSPGPDLGLLTVDIGWLVVKGMGYGSALSMSFSSPSAGDAGILMFPAGPGHAFSLAVTAGMSLAGTPPPAGDPSLPRRLEVFMALPPSWDGLKADDPETGWAARALLAAMELQLRTSERLEEGAVLVLDEGFLAPSGFSAVLLAKSRAVPPGLQTLGEGPDAVDLLCLAPLYPSEEDLPARMGASRFLARFGDELLSGPVRPGRPPLPAGPGDARGPGSLH